MSTPAHPTPACSPECVLLHGADAWLGPLGEVRGVVEIDRPNDYRDVLGHQGKVAASRWFVICPEEEARS
jgi:hypothetical protein